MSEPSEVIEVADDRRRLRRDDDAVPWSPAIIERSIPDRFAEIVRRFADRPAVVAGGSSTSYARLDVQSASIASAVLGAIGARDPEAPVSRRPIAILMDQGPGLPAAAMGALRTGAPFVPVDPAYPEAPVRARLDHADAAAVLVTGETSHLARRVAGDRPVIDIGPLLERSTPEARAEVQAIDPDAPATLFYTSGSTGRPKGVLDSHRNVLHNVGRYTSSLGIGPGDRLTLVHAPTFSGIVSTLFAGLLNGAAILPFDLRHGGLERVGAWLREERATMLHCVPVVARAIFDGDATYPDLRVVRLEGDLATWADVERFARHTAVGTMLVNGLGATETGLTRQFFIVNDPRTDAMRDDRTGALPIGYPVPDMIVSIRDDAGDPVADGSPGEIVVASRFLALGYHRDPDRTAAAFGVDDDDASGRTYRTGDLGRLDPDGRLHHLGRLDGSAKVNSQTVDTSEIERLLGSRPDVQAAVVGMSRDGTAGEARLVAYVVRAPGQELDVVRIRRELRADLPGVEVPSVVVEIPAVPVTSSGKVDRSALPAPGHGRPPLASAFRSAVDPLEEELIAIWTAAIGVAPIGVDDDFFDLGGDSLAALRMLVELETTYGLEASADLLAQAPTIAALAAELRRGPERSDASADPRLLHLAHGSGPPLFAIHASERSPWFFRPLARSLDGDRPFVSLGPDDTETSLRTEASIDRAVAGHLDRIRAVQPTGPYHLVGFCYGGLIAFEIAHRLRAAGEDVALLALLSITPLEFPTLLSPAARRRYRRSVIRLRYRGLVDRWRRTGPRPALHAAADRVTRIVAGSAYRRRALRGNAGAAIADAPDRFSARAAEIDAYLARPYPGEVLVVVGREATPRFVHDPHVDFAGLSTQRVRVAVVAGDDHAMLAAPGADGLARILTAGPSGGGRYDSAHVQ